MSFDRHTFMSLKNFFVVALSVFCIQTSSFAGVQPISSSLIIEAEIIRRTERTSGTIQENEALIQAWKARLDLLVSGSDGQEDLVAIRNAKKSISEARTAQLNAEDELEYLKDLSKKDVNTLTELQNFIVELKYQQIIAKEDLAKKQTAVPRMISVGDLLLPKKLAKKAAYYEELLHYLRKKIGIVDETPIADPRPSTDPVKLPPPPDDGAHNPINQTQSSEGR